MNHGESSRGREAGARHQPLQLDGLRAGNDDHAVAQEFTIGFIKEWDIGQEKFAGLSAFFRCSGPLTADARMQDSLERALLFSVGENYRPKCGPIQIPARRKNLPAKFLLQEVTHLGIAINEQPGGAVGVEKLRAERLSKAIAKSGFAGGNTSGDPDDGADAGHQLKSLLKEPGRLRQP